MRLWNIIALAAPALAVAGCSEAEPGLEVKDAWVRLPPIPERPGAGYFTVEAAGERAILTAVDTPAARRVELHETRSEGGTSGMVQVGSAEVPADGALAFEPGGRHLMLFGLDPTLKPGATLPLTFRFAGRPPITVEAELRAPGEGPPHGGH